MSHYEALSGTNVFWDFVELPSQFMENFSTEPEFLSTFARHYQTGEPLPASYIDALRAARQFQAGYQCLRQLSFGFLDMAFYDRETPLTDDVTEFERRAMEKTALLPCIPEACVQASGDKDYLCPECTQTYHQRSGCAVRSDCGKYEG